MRAAGEILRTPRVWGGLGFWRGERFQSPISVTTLLLILAVSFAVQSVVIEPALGLVPTFNAWPYLIVFAALLILPMINTVATQMVLFLSISVVSALGLAEPLTGSHAAGSSPVIFGLSFFTATLAYHGAKGTLLTDRMGRGILYGSALFLYTGPILTRFSAVRIDFRRAYVGASYFLLGLFMFWVVAKNIVPLLALRDLTSFWDVVIFGAVFEVFVYFNFAGLSLLIYGVALFCGLRIPLNFRQPFSASNLVEFWRAWHITLAMVLKEVFYLRFKRVATTDLSIVGVFLASALWHGVTLNFIIWGLFHGAMFVVAKHLLKRRWLILGVLMMPVVLILGRALFAENRSDLLLDKIGNVITLDGLTRMPNQVIALLMDEKLAALSLMLGLGFILGEVIDGRRRVFQRRRYAMYRSRWPMVAIIGLICLLGQAGGGDVYAVYGQR